jgi:dTDP-4-dehydrorhamnose reductase
VWSQPAQAATDLIGLYHVVASGHTTWFDYAKEVLSHVRQTYPAIKIVANVIDPVPTSAFQTAAKRPLNSRLNTGKFQNTFKLTLPHWKQGVTRMLTEFTEKQT